MDAGRRQTEYQISRLQTWPGQERPTLGGAHGKASDVEIASGVEARHLRRLAADQRASGLRASLGDALHDRRHDVLVELAGCKIIQEKQWLGALNDNVVDAHGHQVDADRVVHAALNGDLQLCADAVVGGDQDRVDKPRRSEIEQSAESAKLRARARSARAASEWAYAIHDPVANIDVDPRLGIR